MEYSLPWAEFTHVINSDKYKIEEYAYDHIPSFGAFQNVGFMMRPSISSAYCVETNGIHRDIKTDKFTNLMLEDEDNIAIQNSVIDKYGIRPCQVILKETIIYLDSSKQGNLNEYIRGYHNTYKSTISGACNINRFFKKYGIDMHFLEEDFVSFEMTLNNDKFLSSHGYMDLSDIDDSFVLTDGVDLSPRYEKWIVEKVS